MIMRGKNQRFTLRIGLFWTTGLVALFQSSTAVARTDQFLTFFVPFADVASARATPNMHFTTKSVTGLVAATATQPNSLNKELNGVNGGINSGRTRAQIGSASLAYTSTSIAPVNPTSVPEPGTLVCLVGGMALLQLVILRRRP
jgi:hypothetical protein